MKAVLTFLALAALSTAQEIAEPNGNGPGVPTIVVSYSTTYQGEAGRAGALACIDGRPSVNVIEVQVASESPVPFVVELRDAHGRVVSDHVGLRGVCQHAHTASRMAYLMMTANAI